MQNQIITLKVHAAKKLRIAFNNAVLDHDVNKNRQNDEAVRYPGAASTINEKALLRMIGKLCTLFSPTYPSIYALDIEGETILHAAAAHDMHELVPILHGLGLDENASTPFGVTPLILAAATNSQKSCKALLALGAKINTTSEGGWTALTMAVLKDFKELTTYLMEQDAVLGNFDLNGNSVASYLAQKGDTYGLKKLIDAGLSVHHTNSKLESLIWSACRSNQYATVKQLQLWGGDINDIDIHKHTPLHAAVLNLDITRIKRLVEFGAEIDAVDNHEETPLFHGVSSGNQAVVQTLIDLGANIHHINKNKSNLLHVAAHFGHNELITLLVERGLNINHQNVRGHTPFLIAAVQNNHSTLQHIAGLSANVQLPCNANKTAYHHVLEIQEKNPQDLDESHQTLSLLKELGCAESHISTTRANEKITQDILDALYLGMPVRASRLFVNLSSDDQVKLAAQKVITPSGDESTLFDFALAHAAQHQHQTLDGYKNFLGFVCNINDYFATYQFENQAQAIRTTLDYFQINESQFLPQ